MTSENHETRTFEGTTLRSLNAMERELKRHIENLMAIDCEDADAAKAILFAVRATEKAIENARAVRCGENRD